eukprot:6486787-Amphidinium_carterae.1
MVGLRWRPCALASKAPCSSTTSALPSLEANRSSFETRKSTYSAAPTADGPTRRCRQLRDAASCLTR